jgi:chemotaxis protein methyltransferase CheR
MEPETLTPKEFERFRELIYRESGNRTDPSKLMLMSNRIRRRVRALALPDFQSYYEFLTSAKSNEEMEQFLNAVTTNETHFFRTMSHFVWFRDEYIPEITRPDRETKKAKNLRIWSAACSTGEEVYSLGICLAENLYRFRDWKISVLGTDISQAVLKEARDGVYRKRAIEEVDEKYLDRYFDYSPKEETWSIRHSVRKLVDFRWHNLMEPLTGALFDLIFIRNVLIYFDRESKQKVIDNLIASLSRGGYLVVGPSEGIYDMLEPLVKQSIFLYQKP